MSKKTSKARRWLTNIALVLMLAGMPALSWYYLKSGFNIYKQIMAELDEHGTLPAFDMEDLRGERLTDAACRKKLAVVGTAAAGDAAYLGSMLYVYEQFRENPDVLFVTFNPQPADTLADFGAYAKKHDISLDKWAFLRGDSTATAKLTNEAFIRKDKEEGGLHAMNMRENIALVDTSGIIRNYYPIGDTIKLNQMITSMSILMPRGERKKMHYEPEKEL